MTVEKIRPQLCLLCNIQREPEELGFVSGDHFIHEYCFLVTRNWLRRVLKEMDYSMTQAEKELALQRQLREGAKTND